VARRLSEDEGIAERTDYRVGDTRCLDLTDATFDAIIAHTLVSHVGDPLAVLTEVTRIVRPDGWAVIFDGDYTSLTLTTGDLEYGKRMEEAIINSLAANPRVMRDMPRLLRRAGLDLVTSMPYVVAEVGKADYWAALLNSLRVLLPKAGVAKIPLASRAANARSRPTVTSSTSNWLGRSHLSRGFHGRAPAAAWPDR
jgi:ubiquinone/menaquinone biosynthesis C-methylase UbiE